MTTRTLPLAPPHTGSRIELTAERLSVLLLLVLAVTLALQPMARPTVAPLVAAPAAFSGARALQDLAVITAQPRTMGTPGIDEARAYLVAQFQALGLEPQVMAITRANQSAEANAVILAEGHPLVVRLPGTNSSGAILVAAHLDSVHTSVAASDCGGCAVTVLEAARALVAGSPLRNDVIFLIDDGEETTRVGAFGFMEQHPWAAQVRVAINQEAMGTAGASLLYVTGPQNGWLMQEALRAMPAPVAYSFINDLVWLTGTGGSHLDQYLMTAPVGLGLAYVGNVPPYHTPLDNLANLDPQTLQQRGEQVVALLRHLGNLPLDGTLTAPDLVYFNLLGHWVVHYPAWVAKLLALLMVVGLAVVMVAGVRRARLSVRGLLWGVGLFWPLALAAMAISAGVWTLIRIFTPRLQVFLIGVSYDRAWYTVAFVAMTAGLMALGYARLRRRSRLDLGVGALVWWALLALLTAWRLPGSSALFTLPVLLALLPLGVTIFWAGSQQWRVYWLAWSVAATGTLLVVVPVINFLGIFSGRAEVLMGLPVIVLLPAPLVVLMTGLLLPLADELSRGQRQLPGWLALAVAVVILVGVGATAQFNETRPKPNMVAYVQEEGQAEWVTLGANVAGLRTSLLDEWTRQFFPGKYTESSFSPWGAPFAPAANPAYRGPAPYADLAQPEVSILEDTTGADGVRHLRLQVASPAHAAQRAWQVSSEGALVAATLAGQPLDQLASAAAPSHGFYVQVFGLTGAPLELELTLQGEGAVTLWLEDRLYQLPTFADFTIAPRPVWMMPSPTFVTDMSFVRRTVVVE